MIRFKDISIPKPCSVDYDALPGDEVKRYCGSCKKHVYDFRGKDEAYLNEVYKTTGKVCGIYYEDQIQKPSLKMQRPFYYTFVTKLIGVGLFLKTLLSSHNAEALIPLKQNITHVSEDSIGVKTVYKGKDNGESIYDISIDCYVNDSLFKSYNLSYKDTLYIPSSFLPTDKIKLAVSTTRRNIAKNKRGQNKLSYYSTKTKEYNFSFKEIDSATIKINYNKKLIIFNRKRKAITGMVCPANYW